MSGSSHPVTRRGNEVEQGDGAAVTPATWTADELERIGAADELMVHRLLPMEVVAWSQGQHLHQGGRLIQPPCMPFYGAGPYGDTEAA